MTPIPNSFFCNLPFIAFLASSVKPVPNPVSVWVLKMLKLNSQTDFLFPKNWFVSCNHWQVRRRFLFSSRECCSRVCCNSNSFSRRSFWTMMWSILKDTGTGRYVLRSRILTLTTRIWETIMSTYRLQASKIAIVCFDFTHTHPMYLLTFYSHSTHVFLNIFCTLGCRSNLSCAL